MTRSISRLAKARPLQPSDTFPLGTLVRKKSGSNWHGTVCGYYSTDLTPVGVAVESAYEAGSVQIYPVKALEVWDGQ